MPPFRRPRLILDTERRLGEFSRHDVAYDTTLCKEDVAREHLFARSGAGQRFLDVGARHGDLRYLLGIRSNLDFDQALFDRNKRHFDERYEYFGLDLNGEEEHAVLVGDVCDPALLDTRPDWQESFDVVYSNNVFEHLRRPWVAAANLARLVKPGGIVITVAPFALRYHESPEDHFRYTHTGLALLFEDAGLETVVSGYDLHGRRNNWQGDGTAADLVPLDRFGAWRENWFVVTVSERPPVVTDEG